MCTKKQALDQKYHHRQNMDQTLKAWVEKAVHGGETLWCLAKEKVPGAPACHANSIWYIFIDFLEKDATINSAFKC